jgi:hypothetical protein
MLIVAVRALDEALIDAMPKRHVELGFLLQVTAVAKLRLRLDQQLFLRFRVVRGVAINAADIVLPVERIRAIEVVRPGCMAGKATVIHHLRGYALRFKIEDELLCRGVFRFGALGFQFRFSVSFARAMTPFAIGARGVFGQVIGSTEFGRVRVESFRNLLAGGTVTTKASLNSRK